MIAGTGSGAARSGHAVTIARAGHVLTMGPAGDIRAGAVAIDTVSGLIREVGDYATVRAAFPEAATVGDERDILVPGFINAHDHLSEGLISGIGETMNLYEWQERLIRPVGPNLNREMARAGALVKAVEMIRSGITTVNDMFVHANPGSFASLGVVDGLEEIGLGGVICFGAHDRPDPLPVPALLEEHEALSARRSKPPISASGSASRPSIPRPASCSTSRSPWPPSTAGKSTPTWPRSGRRSPRPG